MIPDSIARFFKDGRLQTMPKKQEPRQQILNYISSQLEAGEYSEKEINQWLDNFHKDYAMLRRFLVDYGYLTRTKDGAVYCKDAPT